MENQNQHNNKHEHHVDQVEINNSNHSTASLKDHSNHSHHAMMIADFKKRFWVSLIVTIPILIFSPMIQLVLGIRELFQFNSENYLLFSLSSFVFFLADGLFLKESMKS